MLTGGFDQGPPAPRTKVWRANRSSNPSAEAESQVLVPQAPAQPLPSSSASEHIVVTVAQWNRMNDRVSELERAFSGVSERQKRRRIQQSCLKTKELEV